MRIILERHRQLLDFTLSALARRKGKNLALLFVYAAVVFALATVLFFTYALRREAHTLLRAVPELLVQRTVAGRHDLSPRAWVDVVSEIRGVARARGRLWGYCYDPITRANFTLVVGAPSSARARVRRGEIAIGPGVARVRDGAGVGSKFLLRCEGRDFAVFSVGEIISMAPAGVASNEAELISSDLVLMEEGDFRTVTGMPAEGFTDVAVSISNPSEVQTVAHKIVRLLPGARVVARSEIARTYDALFDWRSGLMILALSGALSSFVLVAWDKASGLSEEERREIGILKAIGWETSDVLLMKCWEGAVISISAFGVGTLAAYAHVFFGRAALLAPVLRGWSVLYPRFRLVPDVSPLEIATLFFLTVVPYTVATLIPSWRAATIDPDTVMKG